jgi:hypothetical protein
VPPVPPPGTTFRPVSCALLDAALLDTPDLIEYYEVRALDAAADSAQPDTEADREAEAEA